MTHITKKYQLLPLEKQNEINNYIDFLISKANVERFQMRKWKQKVKSIEPWTSAEVKLIQEAIQKMNEWKITKW